jgi:hypothetical protein
VLRWDTNVSEIHAAPSEDFNLNRHRRESLKSRIKYQRKYKSFSPTKSLGYYHLKQHKPGLDEDYLLPPWYRTLFEKLMMVTQLVKKYPVFFMEPKGSSPCSQKPATASYPELSESSSPH